MTIADLLARIEKVEGENQRLEAEHNALADDFADLCDELRTNLSKLRVYRQHQKLLHRMVCEVMGLVSEAELVVPIIPGQSPASRGPRSILKNPARAARYIIIFLLRLTDAEMATLKRIKRDYGVEAETRNIIDGMAELLLQMEFRRKYRAICARYAQAQNLPPDWCPEPSFYSLKKAALEQIGPIGRPPQSYDD